MSLLHHVYKLKSPGPIRSNSCILKIYYLMAKSKAQGGSVSGAVVSPSLLAQIDATNHKPKHQFLLGLGEPFKPNPWDISDSEDNEKDLLMASQMAKKSLTQSKQQSSDWLGSPKLSAKLDQLHKDGIPKSTRKQTDRSLSVWSQWLCYRSESLVEADECVHELKQGFTAMTKEASLFWLPKFVAEIRKSDGSLFPPNSVDQICCGLSRALKSANRVDIDMFNSPKFTQF